MTSISNGILNKEPPRAEPHAWWCERSENESRKNYFVFLLLDFFIVFTPVDIKVKVASDDSIEYDGRIYKLSPFVGTFMPEEKRNTSGAYQGAKYLSYNGIVLDDLRKVKEQNTEE